ncbi:MAG: DinB family protein [Candidatus Thorarchaeota archaeon]
MSTLLERIMAYWQWADNSIWSLVSELSDSEFEQTFDDSVPSIRQRYVHLAQDNWEWYTEWTGTDLEDEPSFDKMSRTSLFTFISTYVEKWANLLSTSGTKTMNIRRGNKTFTLTLPEILFHMSNHATYHRGQITQSLRLLGKEVHMTDYVPFRLATA